MTVFLSDDQRHEAFQRGKGVLEAVQALFVAEYNALVLSLDYVVQEYNHKKQGWEFTLKETK